MMLYQLHFGLYPRKGDKEARIEGVSSLGHYSPDGTPRRGIHQEFEYKVPVNTAGRMTNFYAEVAGSWLDWNPEDKDARHDNSLHIEVQALTPRRINARFIYRHWTVLNRLARGQMLTWGTVTEHPNENGDVLRFVIAPGLYCQVFGSVDLVSAYSDGQPRPTNSARLRELVPIEPPAPF